MHVRAPLNFSNRQKAVTFSGNHGQLSRLCAHRSLGGVQPGGNYLAKMLHREWAAIHLKSLVRPKKKKYKLIKVFEMVR